jgi:hypothetical protein
MPDFSGHVKWIIRLFAGSKSPPPINGASLWTDLVVGQIAFSRVPLETQCLNGSRLKTEQENQPQGGATT